MKSLIIIKNENDNIDVILTRSERSVIYTRYDNEDFLQSVYNLINSYPDDYLLTINDIKKKVFKSINLPMSKLQLLDRKLDYNGTFTFLTGKK